MDTNIIIVSGDDNKSNKYKILLYYILRQKLNLIFILFWKLKVKMVWKVQNHFDLILMRHPFVLKIMVTHYYYWF